MTTRIPEFRHPGLMLAMAVVLGMPGCQSVPRSNALPASLPQVLPGPPLISTDPAVPMLPPVPEAVYRNPKIGLVYLRAHQDVEGRLLGPQVMYQIVDPGGWNTEAVEEGRGFIPVANQEVPPGPGLPSAVPARVVPSLADSSPLLDPVAAADIVITGLLRLEDKPAAEELARKQGPGARAQYDEQAGWLLLPPVRPP
jgi:hypothetical protein